MATLKNIEHVMQAERLGITAKDITEFNADRPYLQGQAADFYSTNPIYAAAFSAR